MTDRRAGSVDVNVDVAFNPDRRVGGVGVNVDYVYSASNTYLVTVTASQAQTLGLAGSSGLGRTLSQAQSVVVRRQAQLPRAVTQGQAVSISTLKVVARIVSTTQAQSVTLRQAVGLVRRLTQPNVVTIAGTESRLLVITQATSVRLGRQIRLTRTLGQGQSASSVFGRGFQRTVTAVQTQAVRLVKQVGLMRRLTGTNRVQTQVALAPAVARTMRASSRTQVRLLKQVRLGRALTQAQSTTFSGLPVQLRVISTVQTRSLALGRNVFLSRLIAQAQALVLKSDLVLERTAVQPTRALLERAVSRVLSVQVATVATLEWRNVTPRYPILVTASVSQHVSLSSAGAGKTAKQFVVDTRRVEFVVGHRSSGFAVARRGVRFTVEER